MVKLLIGTSLLQILPLVLNIVNIVKRTRSCCCQARKRSANGIANVPVIEVLNGMQIDDSDVGRMERVERTIMGNTLRSFYTVVVYSPPRRVHIASSSRHVC